MERLNHKVKVAEFFYDPATKGFVGSGAAKVCFEFFYISTSASVKKDRRRAEHNGEA